jgi:hypothetical protein
MSELSAYVPEPMTEHPHYAGIAAMLRGSLERKSMDVQIAEQAAPVWATYGGEPIEKPTSELPTRSRILTRKKCAGPAPATIDARWEDAYYIWDVLVDDVGRHVAGPARLEVHPRSHR